MSSGLTVLRLRLARNWRVMLAVSTTATLVAVVAHRFDLLGLRRAERAAYDRGLQAFTGAPWFPWGQAARSEHIVVVAIDDKTFDAIAHNESYRLNYGSWPYSRQLWGEIAAHLVDEGARMVVFDAVMDEPHADPSGDVRLGELLTSRRIPFYLGFSFRAKVPPLPRVEPRNRLPGLVPAEVPEGAALAQAPGDGADAAPFDEDPVDPTHREAERLERAAHALSLPIVAAGGLSLPRIEPDILRDERGRTAGTEPRHPSPPIAPLLDVLPGFGAVTLEVDPEDGTMRRTRFAYTDGANAYPTLSLAVAADYFRAERVEIAPGRLTLGSRVVAINFDGTAEIDFGGDLSSRFQTVSLINVLDDAVNKSQGAPRKLSPGMFRDKIVVLAGFALGTADVKPTPFDPVSPGVAKHAAELENLLFGRFITEAPFWLSVLLAFGVALLSTGLITLLKSPVVEIGWPVLLFFGFFAVTGAVLVATRVHVLSAMPAAAGELASLAAVAFNHLLAKKDREQMRAMFSRYMDKGLVDQMVEQRELPKLEGEDLEVTAYFSDIRGFSTFSEQLRDDPRALLRLLNTYLTRVTDVLARHGACIDKYIGDAVVCLFGAPVRTPDHAIRACRAALAVQDEIARLREEFRAEGLPDVYTRIGLNTDVMLVGNIGSAQLLDYTAIGDGMNLAARLEGANKAYDTLILIGPRTAEQVKDHFELRELDWVRVAGKTQAVQIFELLAEKGRLPPEKQRAVALYAQALRCFRDGRFGDALAPLDEALAIDPADGPCRNLSARCRKYLEAPPPTPFDGVTNLEK